MLCEKKQLIPASAGLVNSAESAPQQANRMCICYMFVTHAALIAIALEGRAKDRTKGCFWSQIRNNQRCKGI